MFLEYEHTTRRHTWPSTTDMTKSDTFPQHIDFRPSQTELARSASQTLLTNSVNLVGVAA